MPYAVNGKTRLYYELCGEGTPLVLIMGLGGTLRAWELQWPNFVSAHQILALDNRGVGRSDKPKGGYTVARFAGDLAAVMDHAGVQKAHVLGISLGGLIAQEFYHARPERVRSLVLCATGVGVNDPAGVPLEPEVMRIMRQDRTRTPMRDVLEQHVRAFYHPDFLIRVPDLVDRLLTLHEQEPQPPHSYTGQIRAALTHAHNSPRLPDIQVPTLVIHGRDDRIWPSANADYLAANIAGARLEIIEGAGHMLPIERPQEFNRLVLKFLAEVDQGLQQPAAGEQRDRA
ncbi:MAG: alpha/beta fold hydrolase [Aquisalimonadaceae bacterium]